jgi:hypothetical protein
MPERLNEFAPQVFEAVYQERLKDALRRADVRAEVIDHILEQEREFKHYQGYVRGVHTMPGKYLGVGIGTTHPGGPNVQNLLFFYASDFASEEARQLLQEFISEARRAQCHNLWFSIDCYMKKVAAGTTDHVAQIVSYAAGGYGRPFPLTAAEL